MNEKLRIQVPNSIIAHTVIRTYVHTRTYMYDVCIVVGNSLSY